MSATQLYDEFNKIHNRTLASINVKIRKLGLKHTKQQLSVIKSKLTSGENNGMYGRPSPMKGLTKQNSEIVKIKSEKLAKTRLRMFQSGELERAVGDKNPMYGKLPWCAGLTKYNNDKLSEISIKSSRARKKYWDGLSQKERDIWISKLNSGMIRARSGTTIENSIETVLKLFKIEYIKNKKISVFYVDFFVPKHNLAIECDGDYWHANPLFYDSNKLSKTQKKNVDRDLRKNVRLKDMHVDLIRFWEHDIIRNIENVKKELWEKLHKKWMPH